MNQDNKFVPLTSSHGNVNGEIANLRDTYLNSEKEYYMFLLGFDNILMKMERLIEYPPDKLFEEAMERLNAIENGEVEKYLNQDENVSEEQHMQNLELLEGEAALLLGVIKDKVLIKQLILTIEEEKKQEDSVSVGIAM